MLYGQISLTHRKARAALTLLHCFCVAAIILWFIDSPYPWSSRSSPRCLGAAPSIVLSCTEISDVVLGIFWGLSNSLGVTAPSAAITTGIPDVFSQPSAIPGLGLGCSALYWYLTCSSWFLLLFLNTCVGGIWHSSLVFEFMTRGNCKYLHREELYSMLLLGCALLFTAVAKISSTFTTY